MKLNYRDSKPIYEQIKESIRRMIVMNVIKQDEKLPSVRVLACKYAINPNTSAKASCVSEFGVFADTSKGILRSLIACFAAIVK